MSLKTHYAILFDYHFTLSQKLLNRALEITPGSFMDNRGYGHGSLRGIFYHLLRTDRSWRLALETGRQVVPGMNPDDYVDVPALSAGFKDEQADWLRLIESLDDSSIAGQIELTSLRGTVIQLDYWRILQHVILHGMQHHSEIANLLSDSGASPSDIDFIFYD